MTQSEVGSRPAQQAGAAPHAPHDTRAPRCSRSSFVTWHMGLETRGHLYRDNRTGVCAFEVERGRYPMGCATARSLGRARFDPGRGRAGRSYGHPASPHTWASGRLLPYLPRLARTVWRRLHVRLRLRVLVDSHLVGREGAHDHVHGLRLGASCRGAVQSPRTEWSRPESRPLALGER